MGFRWECEAHFVLHMDFIITLSTTGLATPSLGIWAPLGLSKWPFFSNVKTHQQRESIILILTKGVPYHGFQTGPHPYVSLLLRLIKPTNCGSHQLVRKRKHTPLIGILPPVKEVERGNKFSFIETLTRNFKVTQRAFGNSNPKL